MGYPAGGGCGMLTPGSVLIALPLFVFWGWVTVLIWLFLLGWAHVIQGHFTATEILMTLVVGAASLVGIGACLWERSSVKPFAAAMALAFFAVLQLLAFRLSLLPAIAHR